MAGRAGELRLRNSAAIEQSLEQLHLKHDWVVVDAVSPANDRLPFLERIPGKAKARAKVPLITIGSDAQHSSDPDAGLARLDIQRQWARAKRWIIRKYVGVEVIADTKVQRQVT